MVLTNCGQRDRTPFFVVSYLNATTFTQRKNVLSFLSPLSFLSYVYYSIILTWSQVNFISQSRDLLGSCPNWQRPAIQCNFHLLFPVPFYTFYLFFLLSLFFLLFSSFYFPCSFVFCTFFWFVFLYFIWNCICSVLIPSCPLLFSGLIR